MSFDNKLAEHIAALTEILGLDAAESGVRELGDILLRGTAVVHDLIGVLDVYLLSEKSRTAACSAGETADVKLLDGRLLCLLFLDGASSTAASVCAAFGSRVRAG